MITWLASYPKSGNTWVRAFLAAYSFSDSDSDTFDLKLLAEISHSESRAIAFEKAAGKPLDSMSEQEVDAHRAIVQARLAEVLKPYQVVKTHNARVMHRGTPLICRKYSARAVYVVRNPLDIVDSMADHCGVSVDQSIKLLSDRTHRLGKGAGHVPQYIDSWSQHVASWINKKAFPTHVARYEDLLADPSKEFRRILQFLEHDINDDQLVRAIRLTEFDRLSASEATSGFAEVSSASTSGSFFRRGQCESWRSLLSTEQIERVIVDHREMMQQLGYDLEVSQPAAAACPIHMSKSISTQNDAIAPPASASSQHQVASDEAEKGVNASGKSPKHAFIPAEWKRWIAENLLRGSDPENLVQTLINNSFPEALSRLEVDVANAHPYLQAARSIIQTSASAETSPVGLELSEDPR